ncbi:hypothetical protein CEXT_642441 [Caerostris extrusa]|uniref:Uncharacterized protein n=1 Tax=Caerostris extrusa TaxID=172846 RepID=A0AAV4PMG7_CAEEX|nr:hypothetical protein CEXT_642441 [Caerostris extrusa]
MQISIVFYNEKQHILKSESRFKYSYPQHNQRSHYDSLRMFHKQHLHPQQCVLHHVPKGRGEKEMSSFRIFLPLLSRSLWRTFLHKFRKQQLASMTTVDSMLFVRDPKVGT